MSNNRNKLKLGVGARNNCVSIMYVCTHMQQQESSKKTTQNKQIKGTQIEYEIIFFM